MFHRERGHRYVDIPMWAVFLDLVCYLSWSSHKIVQVKHSGNVLYSPSAVVHTK